MFSFENRNWDEVGPGFGTPMPYLHTLGTQCSWFPQWTEIDPHQKSLSQYVGQVTGTRDPATVDDCKPSATCHTTSDSVFRQVRTSGRTAINDVEGPTTPCSDDALQRRPRLQRPGRRHLGARTGIEGSSAGTLRAWQSMLSVPCLADACSAPDLRPIAHS